MIKLILAYIKSFLGIRPLVCINITEYCGDNHVEVGTHSEESSTGLVIRCINPLGGVDLDIFKKVLDQEVSYYQSAYNFMVNFTLGRSIRNSSMKYKLTKITEEVLHDHALELEN